MSAQQSPSPARITSDARSRLPALPFLVAIVPALFVLLSFPAVTSLVMPASGVIRDLTVESFAKPPAPPPTDLDVAYRRTLFTAERLDIYGPTVATDGPPPVIVFLHGGSWIHGDKVTIRVVDRFLSRMRADGSFVIAVNYTTSVLRGIGGPLSNVQAAIRWIAAHADEYGYDPHRIGLYGVSAGGHLALMAASLMHDEYGFSFVFAECAPTDLVAMAEGDAFESSSTLARLPRSRLVALSPIRYVSSALPPILAFHGELDRTVAIGQSERYVAAVNAAGGDAVLVRYAEGDHAFLNMTDAQWHEQETRALAFFRLQFSAYND